MEFNDSSNLNTIADAYFAMGEAGIASTILSASLGHTDLDTVHKFYLSANHKQASKIANQTIEKITHQDLDDFTNN